MRDIDTQMLSHARPFVAPWAIAHQASLYREACDEGQTVPKGKQNMILKLLMLPSTSSHPILVCLTCGLAIRIFFLSFQVTPVYNQD